MTTPNPAPDPERPAIARAREYCALWLGGHTYAASIARDVVAPLLAEAVPTPSADPGADLAGLRLESNRQLDSVRCCLAELEELAGRVARVIDSLSRAIRAAEGAIRAGDLEEEGPRW
jgi:HAMP domain-containing protein